MGSTTHDPKAWSEERKFISSLMKKCVVNGGRKWTREELYDRKFPMSSKVAT